MDEHYCDNLIHNPDFLTDSSGHLTGWAVQSPRDDLAPGHLVETDKETRTVLSLKATGKKYIFGAWTGTAKMEIDQWYVASVRARIKNIAHPDLSLLATVANHFLVGEQTSKNEILLTQTFRHSKESDGNKMELFLRATETGSVQWFAPRLVAVSPPKHRMARVATVRFDHSLATLTLEDQQRRIITLLDQAGAIKADIVVLPEFSQIIGVPKSNYGSYSSVAESIPEGPVSQICAKAARKYNMYVIGSLLKRDHKNIFNSAVIFDRTGAAVGSYDKTHLTFDELQQGISCGIAYPLFHLDFGTIAIHICYDSWFPEISRFYACQGAQILFCPLAGGKPIAWRMRAMDNGIYFVAASINPPSMIIDSSGEILAQTQGEGVAFSDLNLDYRQTNVYGDPTLVYGMPCVQSQMQNVLDKTFLLNDVKNI